MCLDNALLKATIKTFLAFFWLLNGSVFGVDGLPSLSLRETNGSACVLPEVATRGVYQIKEDVNPGTVLFTIGVVGTETWTLTLGRTDVIDGSLRISLRDYFKLPKIGQRYEFIINKKPDLEKIYELYNIALPALTLIFTCTQPSRPSQTSEMFLEVLPVNEFAPQFIGTPLKVYVPEDTEPGKEIYSLDLVTKDNDISVATSELAGFNVVEYSADIQHDGRSYFSMVDKVLGGITLTSKLDYETLRPMNATTLYLNVSASDSHGLTTFTTLTVYITDVDDLPPEFYDPKCPSQPGRSRPCLVKYEAKLYPGFQGDLINLQPNEIQAHDMDEINNQIVYTLVTGPGQSIAVLEKFNIDEQTGVVTLLSPFTDPTTVDMVIVATENSTLGRSTQASLQIKVVEKSVLSPTYNPVLITGRLGSTQKGQNGAKESEDSNESLFLVVIIVEAVLIVIFGVIILVYVLIQKPCKRRPRGTVKPETSLDSNPPSRTIIKHVQYISPENSTPFRVSGLGTTPPNIFESFERKPELPIGQIKVKSGSTDKLLQEPVLGEENTLPVTNANASAAAQGIPSSSQKVNETDQNENNEIESAPLDHALDAVRRTLSVQQVYGLDQEKYRRVSLPGPNPQVPRVLSSHNGRPRSVSCSLSDGRASASTHSWTRYDNLHQGANAGFYPDQASDRISSKNSAHFRRHSEERLHPNTGLGRSTPNLDSDVRGFIPPGYTISISTAPYDAIYASNPQQEPLTLYNMTKADVEYYDQAYAANQSLIRSDAIARVSVDDSESKEGIVTTNHGTNYIQQPQIPDKETTKSAGVNVTSNGEMHEHQEMVNKDYRPPVTSSDVCQNVPVRSSMASRGSGVDILTIHPEDQLSSLENEGSRLATPQSLPDTPNTIQMDSRQGPITQGVMNRHEFARSSPEVLTKDGWVSAQTLYNNYSHGSLEHMSNRPRTGYSDCAAGQADHARRHLRPATSGGEGKKKVKKKRRASARARPPRLRSRVGCDVKTDPVAVDLDHETFGTSDITGLQHDKSPPPLPTRRVPPLQVHIDRSHLQPYMLLRQQQMMDQKWLRPKTPPPPQIQQHTNRLPAGEGRLLKHIIQDESPPQGSAKAETESETDIDDSCPVSHRTGGDE